MKKGVAVCLLVLMIIAMLLGINLSVRAEHGDPINIQIENRHFYGQKAVVKGGVGSYSEWGDVVIVHFQRPDGSKFSVEYRFPFDREETFTIKITPRMLGEWKCWVVYPHEQSIYPGLDHDLMSHVETFMVVKATPTITFDGLPAELSAGDNLNVLARVEVDGVPTIGVPVSLIVNGDEQGSERSNVDGEVRFTVHVPDSDPLKLQLRIPNVYGYENISTQVRDIPVSMVGETDAQKQKTVQDSSTSTILQNILALILLLCALPISLILSYKTVRRTGQPVPAA